MELNLREYQIVLDLPKLCFRKRLRMFLFRIYYHYTKGRHDLKKKLGIVQRNDVKSIHPHRRRKFSKTLTKIEEKLEESSCYREKDEETKYQPI